MRILLTGAGFTRNWGGLLASEFVGELCGRLQNRPHMNEMLRVQNNFEETLGIRRSFVTSAPGDQAAEDVRQLEAAIIETFREMNTAIAKRALNSANDVPCSIRRFLARFDAIYSLNQDLFFELHYDQMELESDGRWHGYYFPGVAVSPEFRNAARAIDRVTFELTALNEVTRERGVQPIYKLHGSSNWRTEGGERVLVIGTGKEETISGNRLLSQYQRSFRADLRKGKTELMTVGYGFADTHINALLLQAARESELSFFLVDPRGTAAFSSHQGRSGNGRNELLEIPNAGICQRQFSEVFANADNVSFRSFERFLGVRR